jgi:hypothetical protein
MDDSSPDDEGRVSSGVFRAEDLDSVANATSSAPHCREPSGAMDAVETGKGKRLEQLRPEQGLERPGIERSSGE